MVHGAVHFMEPPEGIFPCDWSSSGLIANDGDQRVDVVADKDAKNRVSGEQEGCAIGTSATVGGSEVLAP